MRTSNRAARAERTLAHFLSALYKKTWKCESSFFWQQSGNMSENISCFRFLTRMLTSMLVFSRNAGCFYHVTGCRVGYWDETKCLYWNKLRVNLPTSHAQPHQNLAVFFLPGTPALLRHSNITSVSLREKRSSQIDWRLNKNRSSLEISKLTRCNFFYETNSCARSSIYGT